MYFFLFWPQNYPIIFWKAVTSYTSDIEFPGKRKTCYVLDKKIIWLENVLVDYLCKLNICVLKKIISSYKEKN